MEIENKIKEQRTAEAVKKDFMGSQGKLAMICKAFGSPIIYDNSVFEGANTLDIDDGFYDKDDSEIKTFEEDHVSYELGYWYDGVNLGNGLEIKFLFYESEIKLYYKSYLRYHEISNILITYNTDGDWEKPIEDLHYNAKKKIIEKNKKIIEDNQLIKEKNKEKLINEIRKNWGSDFV